MGGSGLGTAKEDRRLEMLETRICANARRGCSASLQNVQIKHGIVRSPEKTQVNKKERKKRPRACVNAIIESDLPGTKNKVSAPLARSFRSRKENQRKSLVPRSRKKRKRLGPLLPPSPLSGRALPFPFFTASLNLTSLHFTSSLLRPSRVQQTYNNPNLLHRLNIASIWILILDLSHSTLMFLHHEIPESLNPSIAPSTGSHSHLTAWPHAYHQIMANDNQVPAFQFPDLTALLHSYSYPFPWMSISLKTQLQLTWNINLVFHPVRDTQIGSQFTSFARQLES